MTNFAVNFPLWLDGTRAQREAVLFFMAISRASSADANARCVLSIYEIARSEGFSPSGWVLQHRGDGMLEQLLKPSGKQNMKAETLTVLSNKLFELEEYPWCPNDLALACAATPGIGPKIWSFIGLWFGFGSGAVLDVHVLRWMQHVAKTDAEFAGIKIPRTTPGHIGRYNEIGLIYTKMRDKLMGHMAPADADLAIWEAGRRRVDCRGFTEREANSHQSFIDSFFG